MEFKASYGKSVKIVTLIVSILFSILIIYNIIEYNSNPNVSLLVVSGLLAIVYIICWLYKPTNYSIESKNIIIHRQIGNVIIDRNTITSVQPIIEKQIRFAVRTFGVGGLFGYFGKFYNSEFGNMTWYVTRKDTAVLITTSNNKKIILSPDEQNNFVQQFNS